MATRHRMSAAAPPYDAETDCKHNQHVKQIKQCVFHLQPDIAKKEHR
jgi:hypothetical protein